MNLELLQTTAVIAIVAALSASIARKDLQLSLAWATSLMWALVAIFK